MSISEEKKLEIRMTPPPNKPKSSWKTIKKEIYYYRYIYLMLMLPIAFFILFRYVPMYGIQLAFKEYSLRGIAASPWIGLDHFKRMMIETDFFRALTNTLIISFQKIIIGFPFPIILAIMINEVYIPKYKRVLQTVYTFPHFLSWIVVAGICLNLFGDAGAMKKIIEIASPELAKNWDFLYNSDTFRGFLVGTDIWKEAGWGTIIYLASIAGIDPALYEAATIDGCNRWQKILYITLPGLVGMIIIQLLLRIGGVMDGSFDQIFNTYSPPVYPVADTIDTFIYRITFQREVAVDMGFPTAVSLFKNVINFVLLISANRFARAFGNDGII